MKRGIDTILTIMALEALLLAGLCLAVVDDVSDTIRLPTDGAKGPGVLAGEGGRQQVGEGQKRPWDCCDKPACIDDGSPYSPLICNCFDRVTSCSSACQKCIELYTYNPPRMYRCLDEYEGSPGPKCKEDDHQTASAGNS